MGSSNIWKGKSNIISTLNDLQLNKSPVKTACALTKGEWSYSTLPWLYSARGYLSNTFYCRSHVLSYWFFAAPLLTLFTAPTHPSDNRSVRGHLLSLMSRSGIRSSLSLSQAPPPPCKKRVDHPSLPLNGMFPTPCTYFPSLARMLFTMRFLWTLVVTFEL